MKNHRPGWKLSIKLTLVVSLLLSTLFSSYNAVTAQEKRAGDRSENDSLVVVNASEDVNGDTSSPSGLISNPGTDGISLPEAIAASNNTSDYYTITFDPFLSGSTIYLTREMPHITQGNVTINGGY